MNPEFTLLQAAIWKWIEQEQLNPDTVECKTAFEKAINTCINSSTVGEYQWNYQEQGTTKCLLREIFDHLKYELPLRSRTADRFIRNVYLTELHQRFNDFIYDLWKTLSEPNFSFLIYIPTFGINFMTIWDPIELDGDHRILPKEQVQGIFIPAKVSKPPAFWGAYNLTYGSNNDAPGYFELRIEIPKRHKQEDPYQRSPLDLSSSNPSRMYGSIFDSEILKIWIFSRLYLTLDNKYLSFGDSYLIHTSPFCSSLGGDVYFCLAQFPQVNSTMAISKDEQRNQLRDVWQSLFSHFSSYYDLPGSQEVTSFAVETLRTIPNIPYPDIRLVLHVFAFEHLLYLKKVERKLEQQKTSRTLPQELQIRIGSNVSPGNKWPVAWVFYKLSNFFNESWQAFTSGNPLEEIMDFIVTAFNYRNEIAHRISQMNTISKFLPGRLYQEPNLADRIKELYFLVDHWFPLFITFILKFLYMLQPQNGFDWDDFILGCE